MFYTAKKALEYNLIMDEKVYDILMLSSIIIPLTLVVAFSIIRGGRAPSHSIALTDPTLALDAVRDRICDLLETFFARENYVLPVGLRIEAVGEHIYSEITDLPTLQQIYVDLLNQEVQSLYFINAMNFAIENAV